MSDTTASNLCRRLATAAGTVLWAALPVTAAIVALTVSTPSRSDDDMGFKGSGWYLIVNAFVWMIDEGPFSSQSDCQSREKAKVAAEGGNNDNEYDCVYLASESDMERVNGGN